MKPVPAHVPAVAKAKPVKVPPYAERKLRTGLRVVAVRKPAVPRIEVRLRTPAGHVADGGDAARSYVLPETLTEGTSTRSATDIARTLQRLGASLRAQANDDAMVLEGGVLSSNLVPFLDLLAEIVAEPSFPTREVAVARDRVAQEIMIGQSQPAVVADEAMRGRLFGKHRYGRGMPAPDAARKVGRSGVLKLHAGAVLPKGSTLVMVGDLRPEAAIDAVEKAMSTWRARAASLALLPPPPVTAGRPTLVVGKPGSVQTQMLFAGAGIPRTDPRFPALALANQVVGGSFASRLFTNVREEKGFTYHISSRVAHRALASTFTLGTAVANEVTAPALVEIRYELSRMAAEQVSEQELEAARRFMTGVTSLQTQTQAGLASYLDALLPSGLGLEYLRDLGPALQAVTREDVLAVSGELLSPKHLLTVLVGDAEGISRAVGPLDEIDVHA